MGLRVGSSVPVQEHHLREEGRHGEGQRSARVVKRSFDYFNESLKKNRELFGKEPVSEEMKAPLGVLETRGW